MSGPVIDEPGLMRTSDRRELSRVLREVNERGTAQIQVVILDSLDGLTIEEAAIRIFDEWKLGAKGKDNGLLFLISNGDRRMRFEVGRGLEGVLPDITAKRILADQVTPLFRAGRPSEGILVGVSEILRVVMGDQAAGEGPAIRRDDGRPDAWIFIGFFILIMVLNVLRFATGLGGRRRGLGALGGGYLGGRSWGGSGGWGGGGGGGWSGGGGGSAGGGASSGW